MGALINGYRYSNTAFFKNEDTPIRQVCKHTNLKKVQLLITFFTSVEQLINKNSKT
jgi:hypothetical protein